MTEPALDAAIGVYTALLIAWNARDAAGFAALFMPDGHATGFDGSQMDGREAIAAELAAVFAHHPTATYVAKIQKVRRVAPTVTLLRAAAGMVAPGAAALTPAVNAIQTLVLVAEPAGADPRITLLQNTPAAFHGRPELVAAMTAELTRVRESGVVVAVA